MDIHKTKHLVSILMESPLYMSLDLNERRSLIEGLAKSYPALFSGSLGNDDLETIDYKSQSSEIY